MIQAHNKLSKACGTTNPTELLDSTTVKAVAFIGEAGTARMPATCHQIAVKAIKTGTSNKYAVQHGTDSVALMEKLGP